MAWTYEQDFEGLTTGDLNGQDSWTDTKTTKTQVIDTLSDTGSQCISQDVSSGDVEAYRTISESGDGITVYISVRVNSIATDRTLDIYFKTSSGATMVASLSLKGDGSNRDIIINTYWGSTLTLKDNISVDTWYRVGLEFDFTNNQIRGNIDDGTWSSWTSFVNNASDLDQIKIFSSGARSGEINYIDDISADYSSSTTHTQDVVVTAVAVSSIINVLTYVRTLSDTISSTVNISRLKTLLKAISATANAIVSLTSQSVQGVDLLVTATANTTLDLMHTIGQILSATISGAVSIARESTLARTLSATVTGAVSLTKGFWYNVTMAITTTATATITRGSVIISRVLSVTTTAWIKIKTSFWNEKYKKQGDTYHKKY